MKLGHLTLAAALAIGTSGAAVAQMGGSSGSSGGMGTQGGTTSQSGMSGQQHGGMASQMSATDIRRVQEQLQSKGYNVGPVDGIMGQQTQSALREFQQAQGMQATGQLNRETMSALGVEGSASGTRGSGSMGGTTGGGTTGGGMGSGASGTQQR